jgi:hypothetical protein
MRWVEHVEVNQVAEDEDGNPIEEAFSLTKPRSARRTGRWPGTGPCVRCPSTTATPTSSTTAPR